MRQSLDVVLAGEILPGVSVRGVLSDRETPLQTDGRTTELTDLDRLYLQVEGPGASMTLGDFALRGPPGLYAVRLPPGNRSPWRSDLIVLTRFTFRLAEASYRVTYLLGPTAHPTLEQANFYQIVG